LIVGVISPIGALMFYGVTGVILGSVAVFLGLRARNRMKRAGSAVGGAGMAQAAWIIGVCAIVLGLVMMAITIGSVLYVTPQGKGV
jgi:heme/copper-type cytochrome/quinol oxidase subunit 2